MKAALYARFSTDNQRDASVEDQFRRCAKLAEQEGFDIVARFEDKGISGGTTERPGYQMLLAGARAHGFDIIVAEDVSRLWRNRAEFGPRSAELEDLGIQLVTCSGDDTRREGWGLILGIKQAIAENYRKDVSFKTKRGLEGKALAGGRTGGRCFGYGTRPDGSWGILEGEAATVRWIYGAALQGHSLRAIASALNLDRTPAPRGGQWGWSTVKAILTNARYTGAVIYGQTEVRLSARDSKRKTRLKRDPLVTRQDDSLIIVNPNEFDRVQAHLSIRPKAARV